MGRWLIGYRLPLTYFILCYFGTPQAGALFLLWVNRKAPKSCWWLFLLITTNYSAAIIFAYLITPKLQYDALLPIAAALFSSCFYVLLSKKLFKQVIPPPRLLKQLAFCLVGLTFSAGYFFLSLYILQ